MRRPTRLPAAALALAAAAGPAPALPACTTLALAVARVEAPPSQYAAFCAGAPAACALAGPARIAFGAARQALAARINAEVNAEVAFLPDRECDGSEEVWALPEAGYGDCEDYALEKRRRLAGEGLPTAAMTMAIVHHRERFFAHAVLLIETDRGTYLLDNLADAPLCWSAAPYEFERRERPDGRWERFHRPNRGPIGSD